MVKIPVKLISRADFSTTKYKNIQGGEYIKALYASFNVIYCLKTRRLFFFLCITSTGGSFLISISSFEVYDQPNQSSDQTLEL